MDDRRIESSLLRLAGNRDDEEAWTALFLRFRPFVYAVAYRRTNGSQDLAQEAVQETFLRLVKYCPFHNLTGLDDFRRYLAVVTRNVVTILQRHELYPERRRGLLGAPDAELGEPILTPHGETVELRQLLGRFVDVCDQFNVPMANFVDSVPTHLTLLADGSYFLSVQSDGHDDYQVTADVPTVGDKGINQNLLPPPVTPLVGPLRPRFQLSDEDISVRNVSFGLEFRY